MINSLFRLEHKSNSMWKFIIKMTTLRVNSPKGKPTPTHELIHNRIFIKGNFYEFVVCMFLFITSPIRPPNLFEDYFFNTSQPWYHIEFEFAYSLNNSSISSDSGKNGSLLSVLFIYPSAFNKNCPSLMSGNDFLCISHNCE